MEARNLTSRDSIGRDDIIKAVRECHRRLFGSRKKGSNVGPAGHAMFAGNGGVGRIKRAGGGVHGKGGGHGKGKGGRRGQQGRGGKSTNDYGGGSAACRLRGEMPQVWQEQPLEGRLRGGAMHQMPRTGARS